MSQTVKTTWAPRGASVTGGTGVAGPERPPYGAAAVAALAVFALYALTLAPTTQFWDTSEYIATAHILGIPHPPGNPLFVVLARAWELLLAPTGLSVAVRINLFSAAMSAAAHGFWFLVAHRTLGDFSQSPRVRMIGAAVAVLLSATAFTVWNQSNVNEKVYTVSLFTIALLSWLAFRWRDTGNTRLPVLGGYLLGLTATNHLMGVLVAPALVVFALVVRRRQLARPALLGAVAVAAAGGWSTQLVLPIRAELRPVIAEGEPHCESLAGAAVSVYTYGRSGCEALSAELLRKQYPERSVWKDPTVYPQVVRPRSPRQIAAQAVNYLQYFDWQWARSVAGEDPAFGGARPLFTLLFLGLGLLGARTQFRRDRAGWAYIATLFATLSAGLVFYLNFKYGYSFGDLGPTEVRERDYFFIAGFSVWGLWAGIGLTALWQRLAARAVAGVPTRAATGAAAMATRTPAAASATTAATAATSTGAAGRAAEPPTAGDTAAHRPGWLRLPPLRSLAAASVLGLALFPLILNWSWAGRAGDYTARDWAYNLLQSVEPYGVLFTNGDNDTFPLWYLQEVEGIRRDVTVIVTMYLGTPWYPKQIRDLTRPCPPGVRADEDPTRILCQRRYDEVNGPALYAAEDRPEPSDTILPLTDEQIDSIAGGVYVLPRDAELRAGRLRTTLPAGLPMTASDTFVTAILAASLGDRPIYFSSPAGVTDKLGLRPFLVRKGLALRVSNGPVRPDPERGLVRLPRWSLSGISGDFIDLAATDTLLRDVYLYRGMPHTRSFWPDRPSANILGQYGWALLSAAQGHALQGNVPLADAYAREGEAWLRTAGFIAEE